MSFNRFFGKLCIVLCAGMLLGGCSSGGENPSAAASADTGNTAVSATEAVAASSQAPDTATAETTDAVAGEGAGEVNRAAEDIAFVRFSNQTAAENETAKENERAVVSFSYDVLSIEKTASDGKTDLTALARMVSEQEYKRDREREVAFSEHTKNAGRKNKLEKYDCDLRQRISVLRADTRVLSYLEENTLSVDTAGAFPEEEKDSYSCTAYNFDAAGAKELRLSDVVNDPEELTRLAAEAVLEKYDTSNPAYNAAIQFEGVDLEERILALFEDEKEAEGSFAWAPAYFGLRLIFSREALCDGEGLASYLEEVSEINPRELRRFDVTIPYTAAPSLFVSSYTEMPVSYMARLENGASYFIDFGNGPVPFQVATPRKYENNTVLYTGECTVRTGDRKQSFDLVGAEEYGNYGVCAFLVKREDAFFLYLDATGKDETDRLHVYALEDGNVRFAGVSEEMLDNDRLPPFDPFCFMTEGVFFILPDPFLPEAYTGNRALRESRVSAGGMPESEERFYEVADEDVRVTAIALSLDTLADPDAVRPEKELYPAGTSLTMWRIERGSCADLKSDDGRIVRLYINGVDTIDLIDGHELNEAFADPRENRQ